MLLSSMDTDHWTVVPVSLLRDLEINIQTVKENLLRKQDLLTKVQRVALCLIDDCGRDNDMIFRLLKNSRFSSTSRPEP